METLERCPHGIVPSLTHVVVQVGSEVARRARGLGMQIIAHDPFASEAKAAAIGVRLVSLNEALGSGDFFSLHTPLTPQTKVCTALEALTCHSMLADGSLADQYWAPASSLVSVYDCCCVAVASAALAVAMLMCP